MNSSYYKDLDTNFEQACKLSEKTFSHNELVELLKCGNIPQKQIAALLFDYVESEADAKILLDNLTGCDGKIREAAANSIKRLITNESKKYFEQISAKIFADATIDINANICRLVVDSANLLKESNTFSQKYVSEILNYTYQALNEIDKFIYRDKKYVINKQIFKLYWCLEALNYFSEYVPESELEKILYKCSVQKEYTIREKTAQIVKTSGKFSKLRNILKNDENYYVRNILD